MRKAILAFLMGAMVLGMAYADDRAEFKKRFRKLKKKKSQIQQHMELLQWCMERGMLAEAIKVGEQASRIDPKDQHIKEALKHAKQEKEKQDRMGGGSHKPPHGHGGGNPMGGGGGPGGDPGLDVKTPADLGHDGNKIRQYVDSLFAWGNKLWDEGKKDEAKKYWGIIRKHYSKATRQIEIIDAKIAADKAPKTNGGGGKGFKNPLEFDDDDDDEPVKKPKKGKKGKDDDDDEVGKAPKKGDDDDDEEVGKAPPVKPEITGGGKKDPKKKTDDDDDDDEEEEDDKLTKKRQADAKKYAKRFEIKSFRVGSNVTFGGTYPQLELVFKNYVKPKYITLVFYGYSRKGKVFRSERTYLGPEVNKRHAIVTAYKKEWIKEHGRLVAGRVEIYYGPRKEKFLMLYSDSDAKKRKYTKNANWYKPGIDDPVDRMGFYRPKQNSFESNTLKRIKRNYFENR